MEDPSFCIDIGNLLWILFKNRKLDCGKLYGSEPSCLDTVWDKIRENGLNVDISRRNSKGKAKEVDTALTCDATEYITSNRGRPSTVILLAGDRDYRPVVSKMLDSGWHVELVAFKRSINKIFRELKTLQFSYDQLPSITELEDIFDDKPSWQFVNRQFPRGKPNLRKPTRIPRKRTMVVEFCSKFNTFQKTRALRQLADTLTMLLTVPCLFHPKGAGKSAESNILFIIGVVKIKRRSKENTRRIRMDLSSVAVTPKKADDGHGAISKGYNGSRIHRGSN
jgi:hypothetical protein